MTTATTNGGTATFTQKALKVIDRARHLDGRNIEVVWVASRGEACANVAEQYIRTPYPLAPADLGTFLHEFSHFLSRDKRDDWRSEYRAADYAVRTYESLELPDVEAVLYSQGKFLHGYLRNALQDGTATREEIRDEVPQDLLPYASLLKIRLDPPEPPSIPTFWGPPV